MHSQDRVSVTDLIASANAPLTDVDLNRKWGDGAPVVELYHFGLSLCSQKVRMALYEKGIAFNGHDINIFPPINENYHPDYVRLRMEGALEGEMVSGYSGGSSTRTEGFDPCVVPTMVDLKTEEILVDSSAIVDHIAGLTDTGTELIPDTLRDAIAREIAIVDRTPHVGILYGAHPDGDYRPAFVREQMPGIHNLKIGKLQENKALVLDDARLTAAYDAKIEKEAAAREFVADGTRMRAIVGEIVKMVGDLEDRLSDGRTWVCGDAFTLADVLWAISLFRFKWLGMDFVWKGQHKFNDAPRPAVEACADRLFARPSFQKAVIEWPGNPPSEYVTDHYDSTALTT